MLVKFWGTRGSISKAGGETLRYGGHTSCIQIITNGGTQLILDCGTGARELGMQLAREKQPIEAHIFVTHTHWDHIQGLPFFTPLFVPGNDIQIYGPHGLSAGLADALRGQMQYLYFPITEEAFGAKVEYHDLAEETLRVGDDVTVTSRYMNHTAVTLGYRIEADGVAVVYCTDHEPYNTALAAGGTPELQSEDGRHMAFLRGADLLIHDAQFHAAVYPQKMGWGHSTVEYAVDLAIHAQVRELALFHHDPARSDDEVDVLVALANERVSRFEASSMSRGEVQPFHAGLSVTGASEGSCIWLGKCDAGGSRVETGRWMLEEEAMRVLRERKESGERSRLPPRQRSMRRQSSGPACDVLLVAYLPNASVRECVCDALQEESDVKPYFADSAEDFQLLVEKKRPALVVFGRGASLSADDPDGLAILQEMQRKQPSLLCMVCCEGGAWPSNDAQAVDCPLVNADCIPWPFTPAQARARISAMLLRYQSKWVPEDTSREEARKAFIKQDMLLLESKHPDPRYDAVTRMCTTAFKVPLAFVSLMDAERQWFKSSAGNLGCCDTPREQAFCSLTIQQGDVFEVPDAKADPRFTDNPLVQGPARLRFYAGVPLSVAGQRVGTLSILDDRPRKLSTHDREILKHLGLFASELLSLDRAKRFSRSASGVRVTSKPSSPLARSTSMPITRGSNFSWTSLKAIVAPSVSAENSPKRALSTAKSTACCVQ
eukprot:jgi/Mesvir1/13246/Mv18979-RA.1